MKHIHIVGTGPRTGTTLMTEAMIACFVIDQHTAHEDRVYTTPRGPGEIYLTKRAKDILVLAPFLDLDPDLYVIAMIRDPRDAIVSRHAISPDVYWAGLRYWNTYLSRWRRIRDHPRVLTIRYEDLVSAPDATQQVLIGRMPFLQPVAKFSEYHLVASPSAKAVRALNGVRPISDAGVGNWKRHLPRVAGQIEIHGPITDDLIEFDYEDGDGWLALVDDVEADLRPSHWPEQFTRLDLMRRTLPAYATIAARRIRSWFR